MVHDCDLSNNSLINYQDEMADYLISCGNKKIQKIDLEKAYNIRSISIFNDSRVIIKCSSFKDISEKIILSIYDDPRITFQNHCHFEQIEIYGSPSLHLLSDSFFTVDNLFLYNKTYQFPLHFKEAFYGNEQVNYMKTQEFNDETIDCENNLLQISLNDNYFRAKCGNLYNYIFPYSKLGKYTFNVNNSKTNFENFCTSKELFDQKMSLILSSFNLHGKSKLIFKNISTIEAISKIADQDIPGTWIEIYHDVPKCTWKNDSIYQEFKYMIERGWRRVCFYDAYYADEYYTEFIEITSLYLYCCENETEKRKVVFISKGGTIAIIVVIFAVIITLFVSTLIIAYCRFKNTDLSLSESA